MKMCLIKKNRAVQRIALFYISQLSGQLQCHFVGLVLYDHHILATWHSDHMIADGTSKRPYQSTRKVRHRDHRLLAQVDVNLSFGSPDHCRICRDSLDRVRQLLDHTRDSNQY